VTPRASMGRFSGTAQKKSIEIRERKSGAGRVSVIASRSPLTLTPEGVFALPACTAAAPRMSLENDAAGDCILGSSARSIARRKLPGVTGLPSEKRNPGRILNVYVSPLSLTRGMLRATSGTSRAPAAPDLSG
jgi:hypothetical protein